MEKKKKPFIVRLFLTILIILLVIVCLLVAGGIYSALDKKNSLSLLPPEYSLHLHMDKAWEAIDPLMDLQAADIVLSQPELIQFRPAFLSWRSSPLRQNKLIALAASRKIDGALYTDGGATDFLAVLDLSYLSLLTRLLPLYAPLLKVDNLSYIKSTEGSGLTEYLCYEAGDSMNIYIKPVKNNIVVTNNETLFIRSLMGKNDTQYTSQALKLLNAKSSQPIRITADVKKLAETMLISEDNSNPLMDNMVSLLKEDALSLVSFGISDSKVQVEARVPLEPEEDNSLYPLIVSRGTTPSLPLRMSDRAQYYTLLNAGSLDELKNAAFPLIPPEKNIDSLWSTGNSVCKMVFGITLEDLLFSWSGKEFAVLGMEGVDNPVFAIEVKDEKRREEIFDKIISSLIVKSDTSLIVDGMRLPELMIPPFLQGILSAFNVNLPSAFYYVHDGYIYFSLSPEPLSALYSSSSAGNLITHNEEWKEVSPYGEKESSVSLFYNLARSTPFFLREDNVVNQVLALYTIGKGDLSLSKSFLNLNLTAIARRSGSLRSLPGFPLELDTPASPVVLAENTKKPEHLFWVEDKNLICSLNTSNMEKLLLRLPSACSITACKVPSDSGDVLWAVTSEGEVYLLNADLNIRRGFPIKLPASPSAPASCSDDSLVIPLTDESLVFVSYTGEKKYVPLSLMGSIKAAPSVQGDYVAVYDKSIMGSIYLFRRGYCLNIDDPYEVTGISFGSPALMETMGGVRVGFITQAGEVSVWKDGRMENGFPINLDGVFYTNLVASNNYFYALSADAKLFRIAPNGDVLVVQIPSASAKEPYISVADPNHNGVKSIYFCPDSNTIYGFNEKLELLSGFPLSGTGTPAFMDINGDRASDCFTITLDNKLNGWNLR